MILSRLTGISKLIVQNISILCAHISPIDETKPGLADPLLRLVLLMLLVLLVLLFLHCGNVIAPEP